MASVAPAAHGEDDAHGVVRGLQLGDRDGGGRDPLLGQADGDRVGQGGAVGAVGRPTARRRPRRPSGRLTATRPSGDPGGERGGPDEHLGRHRAGGHLDRGQGHDRPVRLVDRSVGRRPSPAWSAARRAPWPSSESGISETAPPALRVATASSVRASGPSSRAKRVGVLDHRDRRGQPSAVDVGVDLARSGRRSDAARLQLPGTVGRGRRRLTVGLGAVEGAVAPDRDSLRVLRPRADVEQRDAGRAGRRRLDGAAHLGPRWRR